MNYQKLLDTAAINEKMQMQRDDIIENDLQDYFEKMLTKRAAKGYSWLNLTVDDINKAQKVNIKSAELIPYIDKVLSIMADEAYEQGFDLQYAIKYDQLVTIDIDRDINQ